MILRKISSKILDLATKFPVITITGPRQSGKTTLCRYLFPNFSYISLEDLDIRTFAQDDPRGFLATYKTPVIIDEIQQASNLFSYIQTKSDSLDKPGQFVLSGSQNFLLLEKVSQTLAGRTAIINLLPFSIEELKTVSPVTDNVESLMLLGFYPRIWDKHIHPTDWYPGYIQTYLERDIRQIKQIASLSVFQKFLKLCAGRTGQLLNLSSLALDIGISHNTVKSWLSILESSLIIYLLKPYSTNINKRLIKTPKLYFYDTGLACSLLGINDINQLITHPLKGYLFESLIASEIQKYFFNQGHTPQHYFLRDKQGHEIDYLVETASQLLAIEIKSGQTINEDYFRNLTYWKKIGLNKTLNPFVVYGNNRIQKYRKATVIPWFETETIFQN